MNWIDAHGVGLRYDFLGTTGPVVVLIHEMGGTLESWDRVAPELARTRRVLRYDTRGAGMSEKITGEIDLATMASDLAALLDVLGLDEPVSVAGCAVGGAIALRFALDFPERTAAVIVLNPAIDAPGESGKGLISRSHILPEKGMRSIEAASLDTGYPTRFRERNPAHYASFRVRWLGNDPVSLGALFRMLARTDLFPELSRIQVPVLGLSGVHDPLRPPAYVRTVVEAIGPYEVIEIDAAHHVPDQAPELVNQHIGRFLDRVQPVDRRARA
ncbi:alpha/beta fold hydrolase [Brucella tritici]|uniref:Alpha/beta fold hydrolase n=1 Tax=Brucella tritici TaxID=94626 RepID=A0A7V7VQG0_9HYPH|nr:alpha/beta hydrolase [Brucella tritici]KAB2654848.1 alpha/beta fold hydrolase [Brucella tritici]